ncbi:MAG: hypothetical protein LAO79_26310, partial [Acidobacteriia bacterium]|nr:hypothetical protein [Terriglobia bacterium]
MQAEEAAEELDLTPALRVCVKMIGVGRFLRSRFLKRLIQRDAGNEPRPQEAANVQFSHRLL